MPPLVIPDTVRCSLIWTMSDVDYAVNVLHYLVGPSTTIGQADADGFAADAAAAFDTANGWRDVTATAVKLARVTVRDLRTANQPEYTSIVNLAGDDTGGPLPPQTALCVTLRTSLAGRRFRGRVYLPGAGETANTGVGIATTTAVTAATNTMNALVTVIVDGEEWSLGVMSAVEGETRAVTAVAVRDQIWDTQRRRANPGI